MLSCIVNPTLNKTKTKSVHVHNMAAQRQWNVCTTSVKRLHGSKIKRSKLSCCKHKSQGIILITATYTFLSI